MPISRRNTLIGLGAVVAGGGLVLGTGAFTTVEAERTVSVETAGDANALLGLEPSDGEDDEGYAQVDDDGLVFIDFETDDAEGLNLEARTTFDELIDVTNNGTDDVDELIFDVDDDDLSGAEEELVDDDRLSVIVDDDTVDFGQSVLDDDLEPGDDAITLGLEIDLVGADEFDDDTEFDLTLVIEANTEDD